MLNSYLIRNARIVNEGRITEGDVRIRHGRIEAIGSLSDAGHDRVIDARGQYLIPGAIDDQVHFREPGLTHKGEIHTEAMAAVAGGITSYMEMPNTQPPALTRDLLEDKYRRASEVSLANYSFYMGTSNENTEEVLRTDNRKVCGVKIFMGASTGNLLVDDPTTLDILFARSESLIATHCEDERTIRDNLDTARAKYGEQVPIREHARIRSEAACYLSSSYAVGLAKKHGTRLHVLHISTAKELELFSNDLPREKKKVTAEACLHHLWFSEDDYDRLGSRIKWNPSIKRADDRDAIRNAVLDGRIDVIATDHAPHTEEEKMRDYFQAPSGGPLVQHLLPALFEFVLDGTLRIETMVDRTSHAVADLFRIEERGYIREGYWADLVLIDTDHPWTVRKENLLYKCGWSPFEGQRFRSRITHTWVNGHLAFDNGRFDESSKGQRLTFDR
jgi:dihydroorotase